MRGQARTSPGRAAPVCRRRSPDLIGSRTQGQSPGAISSSISDVSGIPPTLSRWAPVIFLYSRGGRATSRPAVSPS
jgi:hypothetical protein